jgi:hypothetical protein
VSAVVVDDLSVGAVTSYTFTSVIANHTINATFAINTYTISGTVTDATSGLPVAGVVMSGLPGDPATDGSGNYSGTVDHGWSGTVTPTKAGRTFDPPSRTYSTVTSNLEAQNYAATLMTFTITATAGAGGTISPSGTVTVNYGADQTFTIIPNEGYHVNRLIVDLEHLEPATTYTFTNVTRNHTIEAVFDINTRTISGTVMTQGTVVPGVPLPGVTITFSGGAGSTITDSYGNYSHTVIYGWSGIAYPSMARYTFIPSNTRYTNITSNISGQNYTAIWGGFGIYFIVQPTDTVAGQAIYPYVLVKAVDDSGAPLAGVTITISIWNNPGGGTLSGGTLKVTTSQGEAVFINLSINNPGNGYVLKVTAYLFGYGTYNAYSIPFNILPSGQPEPE